MLIDVVFTPNTVPVINGDHDIAIIIDVLRASTTMCSFLHHGASEIHIASSIDNARQMYSKRVTLSNQSSQSAQGPLNIERMLLAGEQRGLAPEGFELGNSPLEVVNSNVRNCSVVYATTNGTRMLQLTNTAKFQFVGCFANVTSLLDTIVDVQQHLPSNAKLLLCCSGNNGAFSLEDTFFAGRFLSRYIANGFGHDLTNAAEAALCIVSSYNQTLSAGFSCTRHARTLASLSLSCDVEVCFTEDLYPVVPVCENLVVRRL